MKGFISPPDELLNEHFPEKPRGSIRLNKHAAVASGAQELADGFPAKMNGPLVFCHQDNLNTDGVKKKKKTRSGLISYLLYLLVVRSIPESIPIKRTSALRHKQRSQWKTTTPSSRNSFNQDQQEKKKKKEFQNIKKNISIFMSDVFSLFSSFFQILLGGFNFGTGSSREQAATALKHKGNLFF